MSRAARQEAILEIVHEAPIGNQSDLVARLAARGIRATQATVSRDVRQLGLVKVPAPEGGSRYLPPDEVEQAGAPSLESLRPLFRASVSEVADGEALMVVKTPIGFANAVALAIDGLRRPEIVGTVAGDDTLFIVLRSREERGQLRRALRELMD